jgi:hypothetical protein
LATPLLSSGAKCASLAIGGYVPLNGESNARRAPAVDTNDA